MIVVYQLVVVVAHLSLRDTFALLCNTFASLRDIYFEPRDISYIPTKLLVH